MRKVALQTLFCSIVVLLAACGGSPPAPNPSSTHPAPLSVYFSTSALSPLALSALNAGNGSVRWSQKGGQYPVLENGVIYADYFDGRDGGVAAFAASDGKQLWFYRAAGSVFITAVVNGVVYATINSLQSKYGSMYALNGRDGTVLWHAATPQVVYGYAVVDDIVYASMPVNPQAGIFGVAAFNAKTGELLWSYQRDDGTVSLLQASNGQAYMLVTSPNGATQVYVSALNTSDGLARWRYPQTGYAAFNELGVGQGLVYLNSQDDGMLYALNASDGSIKWRSPHGGEEDGSKALLTNDTLYVGSGNGTVYALDAADGSLKWQAQIGEGGAGPEAAADGLVYVSGFPAGLSALNESDGAVKWVHPEPQDALLIVAAMNGAVYAYTNNVDTNKSTIYAFSASDGSTRWSYQAGLVLVKPVVG